MSQAKLLSALLALVIGGTPVTPAFAAVSRSAPRPAPIRAAPAPTPLPQLFPAPAAFTMPQAPGIVPSLPSLPALPVAPALRATPEFERVLEAAERREKTGLASLSAAAAAESPSAAHASLYDGAGFLSQPPELPLPVVRPAWRQSGKGSEARLRARFDQLETQEWGAESAHGSQKTIERETVSDAAKDVTPDEAALSFGRRDFFSVSGAVEQPGLLSGRLAWIDARGRLALLDRKTGAIHAYKTDAGPVKAWAQSADGRHVYVAAGSTIQRWDLDEQKAFVLDSEAVRGLEVREVRAVRGTGAASAEFVTPRGHLFWTGDGKIFMAAGDAGEVYAEQGTPPTLRRAQDGYYIEDRGGSTRIWQRGLLGPGTPVRDIGSLPYTVRALAYAPEADRLFAATPSGFLEWDPARGEFRHLELEGYAEAAAGREVSLSVDAAGRHVLVSVGDRLFSVDLGEPSRAGDTQEAKLRAWSDENPMFVKDGLLHIGAFTFPVQARRAPAVSWWKRLLAFFRLVRLPAVEPGPGVLNEIEWKALNLPSNKWAVYQTLLSFQNGINTLYIGETGGGKTWMAEQISKLIGRKLYMVSFTEYTKNQDLLFSRTFGEEGKGRTGKTLETVLKWLDDPEGGILLLDEIHKPLEGVAALNNVLQNMRYHFNGRDIVGDRKTHFVIATMNPVKPPYKGEPPSGELSSRFGTTLRVNYLPALEEEALLKVFFPGVSARLARTLVEIAGRLRRSYPDVLPLPISTRTLVYIVTKIVKGELGYVEAFRTTYNPDTIVEDASIGEAIEKALEASGLDALDAEQKKKPLTP